MAAGGGGTGAEGLFVIQLVDMGVGCGTELGHDRPFAAVPAGKAVLGELVADALRYRHSAESRKFLKFLRGFRQYKPFNAFLADMQRPGARYVLPAGRWEREFRHRVKAGSAPLMILKPFGPVAFVYDVADVEPMAGAPPLPNAVTDPFCVLTTTPGSVVEAATNRFVANAVRDGVQVVRPHFGAQLAGRLSVPARTGDRSSSRSGPSRRRTSTRRSATPARWTDHFL